MSYVINKRHRQITQQLLKSCRSSLANDIDKQIENKLGSLLGKNLWSESWYMYGHLVETISNVRNK
jgi:hypothetical protein